MKKRPKTSMKRYHLPHLSISGVQRMEARMREIDLATDQLQVPMEPHMRITQATDLTHNAKFHAASGGDIPLGGIKYEMETVRRPTYRLPDGALYRLPLGRTP